MTLQAHARHLIKDVTGAMRGSALGNEGAERHGVEDFIGELIVHKAATTQKVGLQSTATCMYMHKGQYMHTCTFQ